MGKLVEALAFAGSRKSDGTPNASGKVWAYLPGTASQSFVFADAAETAPLTQPVVLDAAGRATIYIAQAVTLHIETSAGVVVTEVGVYDDSGVVNVLNPGFTGTLPDGSQGRGGLTTLDAILTSASLSFGGTDFAYLESPGSTQRGIAATIRDIWVSVKDHGAVGDGLVDDYVAIQIAVNRVIALGGGTVKFPPGNYLCSSPIQNSSAVPVSILGSGSASTIKNTSFVNGLFVFNGSGGYSFRDIYLDHASYNSGGAAISVSSTFGLSFDNVQIHNHNIGIRTTGAFGIQDIHFNRVRVVTPGIGGAGERGIKIANGVSESCRITNCYLGTVGAETALELAAGSYPLVVVSGTSFYGGILMASVVGNVSVFGCAFGAGTTKRFNITGTVCNLRQWGNGVDGLTQTLTTNGQTATIDWTEGLDQQITANSAVGIGVTVTTIGTTPPPTGRGVVMTLRCFNAGVGAPINWTTLGMTLTAAVNTAAGMTTELTLFYDIARFQWFEVGRSVHA